MNFSRFANETIDGVSMTRAEWCEKYGVKYETVCSRVRRGATFERAIKKPFRKFPTMWDEPVTLDGETLTRGEWCDRYGIGRMTVYQRMNKLGASFEKAVKMPVKKRTASIADTLTVTVDGITKTMREWCDERGLNLHAAVGNYRLTKDVYYCILPNAEKKEYRREHGIDLVALSGKTRKLPEERVRFTTWYENELSLHPTREVVEMCTNCPHEDCIMTITHCLNLKKEKERKGGAAE